MTVTVSGNSASFSITLIDDSISDINETIDISLSPTDGDITFVIKLFLQTITIVDDEVAPTITLASSASSIAENAGSSITFNSN